MAGIGLKNFKYAKLNSDGQTYGTVKTLAGAIECKVTLDLSEASLYADDALREQVSLFKSGTLTAGIDDDDDTVFAELLGKTVDQQTGVVTSNSEDTPIYVGFGHIVPKMISGVKKYKVEFLTWNLPRLQLKPQSLKMIMEIGKSIRFVIQKQRLTHYLQAFLSAAHKMKKVNKFDR